MGPPVCLARDWLDVPRLVAHPEVQPEPGSILVSPLAGCIIGVPQVRGVAVVVLRLARRGDPLAGLGG